MIKPSSENLELKEKKIKKIGKRETPKIKVITSLAILKTPSDEEWQPPNSTTSLPKNANCDTSKNVPSA